MKDEMEIRSTSDDKFMCSLCSFSVNHHYFGNKPPFARSFILLEDAYIMKDPFTDNHRGKPVIVGGHCSQCDCAVCMNQDCSLFYTKRFCLNCVMKNIEEFPDEIRQEVQRRQQRKQSGV